MNRRGPLSLGSALACAAFFTLGLTAPALAQEDGPCNGVFQYELLPL